MGRMRVGELVGKVLAEEHADLLGQAVRWLAEQLMQAEVTVAAPAPATANATPTVRRAATATASGPKPPRTQAYLAAGDLSGFKTLQGARRYLRAYDQVLA
jgi:hypothetical protein